jgi:hypothetical protein
MNLYNATLEWEEILVALGNGQNVTQAVAAGNSGARTLAQQQNIPLAHLWKVIGNGTVTIR